MGLCKVSTTLAITNITRESITFMVLSIVWRSLREIILLLKGQRQPPSECHKLSGVAVG
jgi:hypothetical protein